MRCAELFCVIKGHSLITFGSRIRKDDFNMRFIFLLLCTIHCILIMTDSLNIFNKKNVSIFTRFDT